MAFTNVIKNSPTLIDEYFLRPLIGSLSRKIYGNNAGIINNILGDISINDKTLNQDCIILSQEGFIRFDEILNLDQIKEIKKYFEKKISESLFTPNGDNELKYNSLIFNVEKDKLIEKFNSIKSKIPRISNLLDDYYKTDYKLYNIFLQRNIGSTVIDNGTKNYFSNQWHNDQFKTSRLKFFIYLDDVEEKNGPLKILNIKKTTEIMKNFSYISRRKMDDNLKQKLSELDKNSSVICKAGTMVFANVTKCLHRASLPKNGFHRDIFAGEFFVN